MMVDKAKFIILYMLWVWGGAFILFLAHPAFWSQDELTIIFGIVFSAACLTVGVAAYLGIHADHERKSGTLAGVSAIVIRTMFLLSGAEVISGLLFGVVMAIYAAFVGLSNVGPGALAGVVVFAGVTVMLLFSLLMCFIPSCVAYAMGMIVGTNLASESIRQGMVSTERRGTGNLSKAAAVIVFAALNAAVYFWLLHGFSIDASMTVKRVVLLSLLQAVLGLVLVGDLWACAVLLWFLWLRGFAGVPLWRRILLLFISLAVAALAAWFTL